MLKQFFHNYLANKERQKLWIPFLTFILGFIFFCFYQQWILVFLPFNTKHSTLINQAPVTKKSIQFYFWKHERWHREESSLLWSDTTSQTITHLVNRWLSLLDEEDILTKKVHIETVSLSESGTTAFISFDRYLFSREASTKEKLFIIESLLKTIRESGLKLSYIYFLVHHKPLPDHHLDFAHQWPVEGFIQ